MSQKVSANVAFIHLNDRIIKQKNYIKYLEEQLNQKNIEYKKLLDENEELKQKNIIQVKTPIVTSIVTPEITPIENKNEISLKITEVNRETSIDNKKINNMYNFGDVNSMKGLTLGDLLRYNQSK